MSAYTCRFLPLPSAMTADRIVGASFAHATMLDQLARIAASAAPTLIEGETGSGKELAARAIHYGGARRAAPFVAVNCGAIPDSLIEAELFGHERGAFTDATRARRGLVAEACGGTLLLDEIDALSAKAQVTLLRFLQDQHYRPVGQSREVATDVRIIAATNRPLDALVAQGAFRADLLYRVKILHLVMPPLRERGDDVELLAEHFLRHYSAQYGRPLRPLHPDTCAWLRRQPWPGNVRELENWAHRQCLMADGEAIVVGAASAPPSEETAFQLASFRHAKAEAVRAFERDYLRRAMLQAHGNVTRAARLAGKERRAFGRLLKKHGIGRDSATA